MVSQKRLNRVLPDGHRVYYVGPRYTEKMRDVAGNHSAYPKVIKNRDEIWIADPRYDKHRADIRRENTTAKRLVVHEVDEDKRMRRGEPYRSRKDPTKGAHVSANQLEGRLRRGEISYAHAIRLAMKK